MSPGKLVGWAFGVFFALAGPALLFGTGVWWENRPAGWPNYAMGPCPICLHIRFPDGPGARLAVMSTAFAKEQAAFTAEKAALEAQGRAVAALKTSADDWQRKSAAAVQQASSANAWRLRDADAILKERLPPDMAASDRCRAAETLLRSAAR